METREEAVDDARHEPLTDPQLRLTGAGDERAVIGRARLERAHDGRSDGDHAPADRPRAMYGSRRLLGDLVGLLERQQPVEALVASRGESRRVRQRADPDPSPPELQQGTEREGPAGGRHLDGPRAGRVPVLHVPERERPGEVRVLHGPPAR